MNVPSATTTSFTTCHLCEAACGLEVTHDDHTITSIRGDADDVHSRGYLCPKATGIADVQLDPERVTHPQRKRADGSWEQIGWDEAIELAAARIAAVQAEHGNDAVGWYHGNPTGNSVSAMLYAIVLTTVLSTKNRYSSTSVDSLPRVLTSYLMYGNQGIIPVPDIDRCDFLLVIGANPVVSNGSAMSTPFIKKRLEAIGKRGGRLVVVDPRRTETVALADTHLAVRPGTDALLLAAMIRTILAEGLGRPARVGAFTDGLDRLERDLAPFTPERVAEACGLESDAIAQLARDFAAADRAACYGRMGTCTQSFGTLATCLIDVLNLVTDNLDREGGAMFSTPALDLAELAARLGQRGSHDTFRSRVSGYPEYNGELPVAALAEEIETPGRGQIRALVIHAGNPVLSVPEGKRLEAALETLDFVVAIDIYKNETTSRADLILPPSFGFEHMHYPLIALGLSVRNVTKIAPAIMPKPPGVLHDWEIMLGLGQALLGKRGRTGRVAGRLLRGLLRFGPKPVLALAVRLGPHGLRGRGLSWSSIAAATHGIDLGPLEPRLPGVLQTRDQRVQAWPDPVARDVARLEAQLSADAPAGLLLISRRNLRCNNSWMHNSQRLVKGPNRCTLQIHPDDAAARSVANGATVEVRTAIGTIEVQAAVSDEMMPGVVSLPHGWGHGREGVSLTVAASRPGASINDITAAAAIDPVSGCASLAIAADVRPAP